MHRLDKRWLFAEKQLHFFLLFKQNDAGILLPNIWLKPNHYGDFASSTIRKVSLKFCLRTNTILLLFTHFQIVNLKK